MGCAQSAPRQAPLALELDKQLSEPSWVVSNPLAAHPSVALRPRVPTVPVDSSDSRSGSDEQHAERHQALVFPNPLARLPCVTQNLLPSAQAPALSIDASSIVSAWTTKTSRGYEAPAHAPQFLLRPSADAAGLITLSPLSWTSASFAVGVVEAGGLRVGTLAQTLSDALSSFTNVSVSHRLPLRAGVAYTVIALTYDDGACPGAFQQLDPDTVETQEQQLARLGAERATMLAAAERARRSAALHAMRARAEASPRGSTERTDWVDFCAAAAHLDELRAEVRRRGPAGKPFDDGWSGRPSALGHGWEDGRAAAWYRASGLAPFPCIVEDGFKPANVLQRALGNCYFVSCLSHLDSGRLDSVFITTAVNPEGVYCVRLWVNHRWRHIFLDDRLPCAPESHRDASGVLWHGAPAPSEGKFASPLAARSSAMNELWPCLLEKAWAMLHGSYANIDGDAVGKMDALSSFPLSRFIPRCLPGIYEDLTLPSFRKEALWVKLKEWSEQRWLMIAGARPLNAEEAAAAARAGVKAGSDAEGVVRNHAYTLLRIVEYESDRLLLLRNPHGQGEWTGRYSRTDQAAWTPGLCAATGTSAAAAAAAAAGRGAAASAAAAAAERGAAASAAAGRGAVTCSRVTRGPAITPLDDGVFWIHLDDFCARFHSVSVTPVVRLANSGSGGTWHQAVARGAFTRTWTQASLVYAVTLPTARPTPADATDSGNLPAAATVDLHVQLCLEQPATGPHRRFPALQVKCGNTRYQAFEGVGERHFITTGAAAGSTTFITPSITSVLPAGISEWPFTLTVSAEACFDMTATQRGQSPVPVPLLSASANDETPDSSPLPTLPPVPQAEVVQSPAAQAY
jgi:hypothetical protein